MPMEGGDLKTRNRRYRGGDFATTNRQYGRFLNRMLFGFGVSPAEMQKAMSDPIKQQMMMQRGGFAWQSYLPIMMMMGNGPGETIANQMKSTPSERAQGLMIRGGLAIPPGLLGAATKFAPLAKNAAIPLAMAALSSLGDNIVYSIFELGSGIVNGIMAHPSDDYCVEHEPRKRTTGGGKKSARNRRVKATRKTKTEGSPAGKLTRRSTKK